MAFVKLYGKILGWIFTAVLMISTSIISSSAIKSISSRDQTIKDLKDRVDCLERSQLTREDIRSELNTFKLGLIEDGMIIVPNRNRRANRD